VFFGFVVFFFFFDTIYLKAGLRLRIQNKVAMQKTVVANRL